MAIPDQIVAEAQAQGVDPALALEVAITESGLDQNAISPTGAIGIFQLEPATAADLGVDPNDPLQNIAGGVRYLGELVSGFGGDVAAALAAYDWGPGNVARAMSSLGRNWMSAAPAETRSYVSRILNGLGQYQISFQPGGILQPSSWQTIVIWVALLFGLYFVLEEV